ncbi:glycosyltransferase [Agrococcus sp. Ld7]|uniref:glycosyltransferase n=1 Tax=Agrococcus sp. Ld7 TaxID=649148 RepID=UPI0038707660
MRHSDEQRDEALLRRQWVQDVAADQDALLKKYEGLLARDLKHRKQQRQHEQRIRQLEAEVRAARKQQDRDLTRRLASAHGSLEAYRKETKRLKDDLQRVRSSNSMRIGKIVLGPLHAVKRLGSPSSRPNVTDRHALETADAAASAHVAPAAEALVPSEPVTGAAHVVPVSERSLDALIREFDQDPSSKRFVRVLNRMWFNHGSIEAPARYILEHPEAAEALTSKQAVLATRILGEYRLAQRGVSVPPRASGIAYVAEPRRVMYCVHSTPIYNSNGYSTRTRGVAAGLQANGVDIAVVARPGYPWDSSTDSAKPEVKRTERALDGVPYVHLPGLPLTSAPIDHYLDVAADAYVREARRQRPSVIQSASNHRTALPALIAARRLGIPFVYEVRGLWEVTTASSKERWDKTEQFASMAGLETLVANEADLVLAITRQTANELIRRGVDPDKIHLAQNAVDTEQFAPFPKDAVYAKTRGIRTDVPVIGFAGSLVAYEGLDTLLDASAILVARGIGHQVVIAGSGGAEAGLKSKRDQMKLATTRFLGRLPIQEMPRLLSTFDVMPLPRASTAVTELVSPLKPLEAFSSMKAVVMSDVAPHRDLVGSEQPRGLLFPPGDAEALADALQRIIEDDDLARQLGRTARSWVFHERTWNQLGIVMQRAHATAATEYDLRIGEEGKPLEELRIGLIADEFTTTTLSATSQVVSLTRTGWREQLASERLDVVFIESAWEGNGGEWHRAIGHYSAAESADITRLLEHSRSLGIPSVFWNKEDPVHFNRFRRTACLCDHVFTTDAQMIPEYLTTPEAVSKTVSSLPFYAQTKIHNPMPTEREYRHSVAHAGTYYGNRYPDRSRRLIKMLDAAEPFGLTIYDRQASNPDSPYQFPPQFAHAVAGSLPYGDVIDSYKSHLAQINVNSVEQSPTMFSRRVVEIAACGGVVLSSGSRAMTEIFGGTIPSTNDESSWRAMLLDWSINPVERVREAWLQMRSVYRAHTADTAITLLARTAGIPVESRGLPLYALVIDDHSEELLISVARQSVPPRAVIVDARWLDEVAAALSGTAIAVLDSATARLHDFEWVGAANQVVGRTHFEDLLIATRFGDWDRLAFDYADEGSLGSTLARPASSSVVHPGLVRSSRVGDDLHVALRAADARTVELLFVRPVAAVRDDATAAAVNRSELSPKRILFAGHDLKFARALIQLLEDAGHEVLIDRWQGHNQHDEAESERLLARADVVFAEWGLGNAVWYSEHLLPHQRMLVRVHLQELQLPYLRRIKHSNVDEFLFVGELIRLTAIESHGVPAERSSVVPNFVDVHGLDQPKFEGAEHTLGLVGIVPQRKRLDLAVELVERLRAVDSRYKLRIKGKRPEEYEWMQRRPEELAFYERAYARIDAINAEEPGTVIFDGHGDDMAEWYRNIGVAISVSDFESFHFTIADGAASGAVPASLAWAGAEYLYPGDWLYSDMRAMADGLLSHRVPAGDAPRAVIAQRYAQSSVLSALVNRLFSQQS